MTNLMHKFFKYIYYDPLHVHVSRKYLAHPQEVKLYQYRIWYRHSQ